MKNKIINKCLNYIKKYNDYDSTKTAELKYGLEAIYLTFYKLIIIIILSIILGIFKEMIIYLILYNILRSTSFGLHATKSWICLISSMLLFVGIPYISMYIVIPIYIKSIICILGIILMYKNSPADTKKRPIVNKKRREIYKFISTALVIIYSVLSIIINNNFISNLLVFSIIMQNIMISPITYRLFNLSYDNYKTYLKLHPEFNC